jgi:hypothetical protein
MAIAVLHCLSTHVELDEEGLSTPTLSLRKNMGQDINRPINRTLDIWYQQKWLTNINPAIWDRTSTEPVWRYHEKIPRPKVHTFK